MTFNDRIGSDEYYKRMNLNSFLSIGFGAALAIVSLVGLFFAPVLVEAEAALVASGFSITSILLPWMNLFSSG
jgi:hypothetical protein